MKFLEYSQKLQDGLQRMICTGPDGLLDADLALGLCIDRIRSLPGENKKLMFIGNGASASIASHFATDYSKNGRVRALAFNDGALLTCLSNDYRFEDVFAKCVDMYADEGDILVAVSSSGKSPNILNGVQAAKSGGCFVITLSGFLDDNPLRGMGDLNLYVAASPGDYGLVEIAHSHVLHFIVDRICALL